MPSTKLLSLFLSFCLILEQSAFAQTIDLSHYFARTSGQNIPQSDKFRPLHLRYLSYDNLNQDFKLLLDKGDTKKEDAENKAYIEENTQTLLKYFFIGLSLPNEKFWVNLRPDSPDNILDPDLEKTDIGRIFLEADLQLKKDTAQFTSPQTPEGKAYWDKLYQKAGELFGTENITIPTLTRPWIVPDEVILRESPEGAYIYKATLKVMLEEDYLKSSQFSAVSYQQYNFKDQRLKELNQYSTQLIKETIIPKLAREINSAKRYAQLRQVYYSLILAQWFKQKYGSSGSVRAPGTRAPVNNYIDLIDSGNLANLTSSQPYDKESYFQQYQQSFKDGEYNLQEPVYAPMGHSIRRYMSGGITMPISEAAHKITGTGLPMLSLRPTINKYAVYLLASLPFAIFSPQISIKAGSPPALSATPEVINYALQLKDLLKNISVERQEKIEGLIEPAIAGYAPLNHARLNQADYINLIPLLEEKIGGVNIKDAVARKLIQLLIKCYQSKYSGNEFMAKEGIKQLLQSLKDKIQKGENEEVLFLWDSVVEVLFQKITIDPNTIIDENTINKVHGSFKELFLGKSNSQADIKTWLKKYLGYGEGRIKMITPSPDVLKEIILSDLPNNIKYAAYTNTMVPLLEETVKNETNITRVLKALAWLTYYYKYKEFGKLIEETLPLKDGDLKMALQIIFKALDANNPQVEKSDSEIYISMAIEIVRAFCEVDTDIAKVDILFPLALRLSRVQDLSQEFVTEKLISLLNLLQEEKSFTRGPALILEIYNMMHNFFSKSSIKFQVGFIIKTASLDAYSGGDNPGDREKMAQFEKDLSDGLENIYKKYRSHWDYLIEKLTYRLVDLYQGRFSFGNLMKIFIHPRLMESLETSPHIDAWSLAMACSRNMKEYDIEYTPSNIEEVIRLTLESLNKNMAHSFFKNKAEVIIIYDESEPRFKERAEKFRKSAADAMVPKISYIPGQNIANNEAAADAIENASGDIFIAYFGHGDKSPPNYSAGPPTDRMAQAFNKNNNMKSLFMYSDCCYSLDINLATAFKTINQKNIIMFSTSLNDKVGIPFLMPINPGSTLGDLVEYQGRAIFNEPMIIIFDKEIGDAFLRLSKNPRNKNGDIPITISAFSDVDFDKDARPGNIMHSKYEDTKVGKHLFLTNSQIITTEIQKDARTVSSALKSENPTASSAVVDEKIQQCIDKMAELIFDPKTEEFVNNLPLEDILPGITIEKLTGGRRGSPVYKLSRENKDIVVKFFPPKKKESYFDLELEGLKRGENNPLFQQLITSKEYADMSVGYIVTEFIPGKSFSVDTDLWGFERYRDELKRYSDTLKKEFEGIPQEHWEQLVLMYLEADKLEITIDANPANLKYDKTKGFTVLDYFPTGKDIGFRHSLDRDIVYKVTGIVEHMFGENNELVDFIKNNIKKAEKTIARKEKVGGIDLSRINKSIRIESVSSPVSGSLNSPVDVDFDLNDELTQLQKLLNAEIIPSADRLKRYAYAACSSSLSSPDTKDSALSLVAETFRLQENKAAPAAPELKDLAAWLEQRG